MVSAQSAPVYQKGSKSAKLIAVWEVVVLNYTREANLLPLLKSYKGSQSLKLILLMLYTRKATLLILNKEMKKFFLKKKKKKNNHDKLHSSCLP